MADDAPEEYEKTEDPTEKKLEDARKRGDLARSQEVGNWFIILAATFVVILMADDMVAGVRQTLAAFLEMSYSVEMSGDGLRTLFVPLGLAVAGIMALPLLSLLVAGIVGNLVQNKPVLSLEPITPKLSKISPLAGFKRLFSAQSMVNFLKSLTKLVLVGAVIVFTIWPQRDGLAVAIQLDPAELLDFIQSIAGRVMIGVLIVLTLIAGLDYAWTRHSWWKKQKMTIKELRDEFKQMQGDPQVRAKLRQLRMERGRQRMMAAVPEASVVITNPTHYSIALKFETGMAAPVCVAKGIDEIALKIRELARENDIPLVANPPLARALHASVEIEEEIPEEHYKAVAEVIGYIMRLKQESSWRR
jgi:flagellar biosynthetic protein FlhB